MGWWQAAQGGGQDTPGILPPGGQAAQGGGQDILLHRQPDVRIIAENNMLLAYYYGEGSDGGDGSGSAWGWWGGGGGGVGEGDWYLFSSV